MTRISLAIRCSTCNDEAGRRTPSVVRRRRPTRAAIAIEPIAQHPDVMSGFATPSSRGRKSHGTLDANVDAGRKQRMRLSDRSRKPGGRDEMIVNEEHVCLE